MLNFNTQNTFISNIYSIKNRHDYKSKRHHFSHSYTQNDTNQPQNSRNLIAKLSFTLQKD